MVALWDLYLPVPIRLLALRLDKRIELSSVNVVQFDVLISSLVRRQWCVSVEMSYPITAVRVIARSSDVMSARGGVW